MNNTITLEKALHKIATLEKDNKSLEKKVFNAEKKNNFLENEIVALKEKNLTEEQFLEEREKEITPLLNNFHTWLEEKRRQVPPSQKLGEAVSYTLNQWEHLCAYKKCLQLTPDNNACERSIRPFVLGRKNWLFSGSPEGAESSCFLFSLIESAKENGLNPFDYLFLLFSQAPLCSSQEHWEKLLPWNARPPVPISLGTWQN